MAQLPAGYEIRELSADEFQPLWVANSPRVFDDHSPIAHWRNVLSEAERERMKALAANMGKPFCVRLGLYFHDEFVGWSTGDQHSFENYYMRNSAVMPAHQRKGLYSRLLQRHMELATREGFQRIYSRHNATNNAVIIPKLKAGFVITSLEVDATFGTLVHLSYFTSPLRRRTVDYRVGLTMPDAELKALMKLS